MRRPAYSARKVFVALVHALAALVVLTLIACSDDEDGGATGATGNAASTGAAIMDECPDLTGTWRSAEYVLLTVSSDGAHEELPEETMTMEVTEQEGCHFAATSTWQGSEASGTEYVAGVLNPDGNWLTLHEAGDSPQGGSTGRSLGRLLQDGQMTLEYAAYSDDGTSATVFSTILSRDGDAPEPETCPDLTGRWTGYPFDVLNVYEDGSTDQQTDTSNVLTIEHQYECAFRGVNTWMRGELGGSEHVAGVLHSDGVLVTILEVGPHPEQGTRAFIQGRLMDGDTMEWDYAGISEDAIKGQGFTTQLVRDGEPGPREECPDLTGSWTVDEWDGLRVHADGTHEPISSDFHDFEIREQIGCTLMAVSSYGALDGDGDDWTETENWVGVIDSEEGFLIMRAVAPPSDRLVSMLFARIASDTELHAEYSGYSGDGSTVLVYLQRLVKE